ncbi:hypothetical protein GGI23_000186 [Coemansia sp. RSA 2559]|nr:hypothetical protein GGI23_000186 [Coemansia sp. RSA 2559]KAJ2869525.1 hypothetical protein GGI22_000186 [Coemansia erecta]
MDAGVPAKSSGQYGAHICATIPRHSSSLEHPPPVNGRANANRGDGAAAVTIPHKAQWNLLLQMVESSMPHVRRLVDALLDCPAAGDGSVMSTVDEIVVPTKMTCYFCGPNKAVVDRHRHLRFSADMFGLINLCATRQWAEAGTFLQHALDMYTAESDDYANNSCAMCWRDRGFMRAMFVSLPSTLMFELDRFNDMRGTNRNVGHLSFPINMDMAPHMVLGRSYTQITTYGLYAVVANNGEREGAGEYTCHVMTDDKCWYFCRAGHGRERVSEETVPGVNACMVFYRRRTPGWNIPECSEPWDVSDPLVL